MGERVFPIVQALRQAAKTRAKKRGERAKRPLETRTPKPKNMKGEVRPVGGVQLTGSAGWMLTMKPHGVEISIAGCVEEMVRDPNPKPGGCPYIGVLPSTLTLSDSYSASHDS